MTRRRRIALFSLGLLVALALVVVTGAVVILKTSWGHERARLFLVAQIEQLLGGRGHLYLGRLDFTLGGHVSLDSLAILDDHGQVIAAASHIEADGSLAGVIASNIRLTRLLVVRPYLYLELKDSVWNAERLFATRTKGAPPPQSNLAIAIDTGEVRDGHIILIMPDSLPRLPPVRRDFSRIELVGGPTQLRSPGATGGLAPIRKFAVESSRPPVTLRQATGAVRWWADSLALDLPVFRLPGSRASVQGSIAWAKTGPAILELLLHADSMSLADIAWITPMIPKRGDASALVRIHNSATPHDVQYAVTNLDLRATRSRLTGGLTAGVGHGVAITDLALNLEPLDLDLVRELLGDSIPKKIWQGTLTGTIKGRGGPLNAMHVDNGQVTFVDRRANGAVSHASFSGQVDAARKTELHGFDVQLQDLDIRTLGAVNRTADSLHGFLTGHLVLEGPTRDLAFHDLALTHVDGDLARSHISGQGRLATDQTTRWLDATLTLDTIALATLARGRTTLPLRGILRGTLELHATRDTMSIDAKLRAGDGTVAFTGTSLLDSVRTWVRGSATLQAFDPRVLIARKEIPFLRLDGTAQVELDGNPRHTEGHVDIALDSTSRIGDSRVTFARVRSGVDSAGFHVDTAEVHAVDWRLSARGRLARTGATHDTLQFNAQFDSLTALRSIVLDSTGASLADSLHGAATAAGVLIGSFDTLALAADFGVRDGRYGGLTIRRASGHAALERLPSAATGLLTFTADSAAYGTFAATRVQARADVRDGRTGHVTADIASSDTLSTRFVADAQRAADTTRIAIDSLGLTLGASRWNLLRPARVVLSPGAVTVDSTTFRSARGATLTLRATVPQTGSASGALRLDGLAPADLAFTNLFSPDLDGRFSGSARLTGTRDAPHIAFTAGFDSVSIGGTAAPSVAATGTYDNKRLKVDARGIAQQRDMVRVAGDLPIDLTLRSVPKRLLDDSLSVKIQADSATLVGFGAVLPGVEELGGTFSANMDVRGTWKQVSGTGTVGVRDGKFYLPRYGTVGRGMVMDDTLASDSLRMHMHVSDGDGTANVMSVDGVLWIEKTHWLSNLNSIGRNFRIVDDPRFATAIANWVVHLTGPLRSPSLEGDAALLTASLVMDQTRTVRTLRSDSAFAEARLAFKKTNISSLRVLLGNDVRLKSRAANVHLTGEVEVSGTMASPYVDGEIYADRGTYQVDLGPLKRTFRVDSGTVLVAGRRDIPAIIDLWTSYVVRGVQGLQQQDITITAHLTGTSDHPTLALGSSDLGTAVAQSELISYLIFGAPSFASGGQGISIQGSATAVLVPSLGGVVEGFLGSVFPFFSSLQVSTVAGNGPQNLTTNPLDGLLNGFALTAGRQMGTESWLTLSGGVCGGSRLASTQSPPGWGSVSAEYRPKNKLSAVASFEPVSSACNGVGRYQFGLDLFRDWKY